MQTVEIGGNEYILRCDLNAYEEILGRYGDLPAATSMGEDERENMAKIKFLAATFINAHNAFCRKPERVTEKGVGALILPGERTKVFLALIETINEAFAPKN